MMEIIKNKEEVKSVMNIIQAFADGKTIQAIDPYEDEWVDQAGLNFKALFEGQYRIKPEHTYRPFANAEECWQEMQKHQPFGYTYDRFNGIRDCITKVATSGVSYDSPTVISFEEVFDKFVFADEVPFGIKVE